MISLKDIYWVAGFIEGEGSFTSQRGWITVRASQVEKQPVEKLQALLGGSLRWYVPTRYPRHQIAWHWVFTGVRAVGLMMTLYSLMSPKRKGQIEKAIKAWTATPSRNHFKPQPESLPGMTLPDQLK